MLSDRDIRVALDLGDLKITPWNPQSIQPASYDLGLGKTLRIPHSNGVWSLTSLSIGEIYLLQPGEFLLGHTYECISVPNYLSARLEGRSSLGREGISIHCTAGFVDPGWTGQLTLEISNTAPFPLRLWALMPIAQISFTRLETPADRPYGHPRRHSRYQGSVGPVGAKNAS